MKLLFWLFAAVLVGCEGTEGTLLVRPEGGSGAGAASAEPFLPDADARWLAQLDGAVDITQAADFFYLDVEQQSAAALEALHGQGRHYLCYLSAGTLENFRDDAELFPAPAIGNVTPNFPNERWLDIRDAEVRRLMLRRVQRLAALGCDGVVPVALNGYAEDSGFELSVADAVDYARFLAEELHQLGVSAGLTGPAELTLRLSSSYDFGLAIDCVRSSQCTEYAVLSAARKPVLHLELGDAGDAVALCNSANDLGFQALISDAGLSGRCVVCRDIL